MNSEPETWLGNIESAVKIRKPGVAQAKILHQMFIHAGTWPAAWKLNYAQTETMEGMRAVGLVEQTGSVWSLTEAGREALRRMPSPTIPHIDRRRKDWSTQT